MAGGLFTIDMFAGGATEDRGGGVPVVWSGADQHVNVFIVEGLAEIGRACRAALLLFAHRLDHAADDALIDVADVANFRICLSQERSGELAAATVSSHQRHRDTLIGGATLL